MAEGEGVNDQRETDENTDAPAGCQHGPMMQITTVSLGQMPLSTMSWHYVNIPYNYISNPDSKESVLGCQGCSGA